jgi:hypothetical protein
MIGGRRKGEILDYEKNLIPWIFEILRVGYAISIYPKKAYLYIKMKTLK